MTTADQTRIALALAACEGLSNEELAERGAGGFNAMIQRKRMYAAAARKLAAAAAAIQKKLEKTQVELAQAIQTVNTLEALDAPSLGDSSTAAGILADIQAASKKPGGDTPAAE